MQERPLRHAYMIIAHNNFPILEKLLAFLDSENADFFIHVDARVNDLDTERFRSIPQKSSVTFVDRVTVSWGHYSLVECELRLLRAATAVGYDYYHLLSGVDVPVKSREYIENYFRGRGGANYINLERQVISRRNMARVKYYYPLQKWNIRNATLRRVIREATIAAQRIVGVDRTKKYPGFVFQKGTQWFSITDALARYVAEREEEIYDKFHDTYCPDEVFLPSMVMNSPYRDTLLPFVENGKHKNCCRYIDWSRGSPYTFTDADYDELIGAGPDYLFARKFDYGANPRVVDRLFEHFST